MAISKMIQSRLDNAGVIGASVETHNSAISEALYSQLLPLCEQGETLSPRISPIFVSEMMCSPGMCVILSLR